jgi:hypothetical protein
MSGERCGLAGPGSPKTYNYGVSERGSLPIPGADRAIRGQGPLSVAGGDWRWVLP